MGGMRRSTAPADRIQARVVSLSAPAALTSFSVLTSRNRFLTVALHGLRGEVSLSHHTITLPVTAASEATK